MMRPVVTLAYAQTLDGRIAARDGSSRWISGAESLTRTHQLRASHDAIMVGIGTVLHDDPRLTVRLAAGRDPVRVVIDRTLRTPVSAAVLRDGAGVGTWIVCAENAPRAQRDALCATGATLITVPEAANQHLDLATTLQMLSIRGIGSVMLEGGSRLITSMLVAKLIDRVAITIAPKLLGAGVAVFGDLGINSMAQALQLDTPHYTPCGADIWIEAEVRYAD